ncbi:unnamed protein product [Owenia fusiformis]|uniref:HECT-type E3 ubiquitin transferase n=1 Tax=Owenia fusiformis TaxID=6347 RepID=A0A8J1Y735_OWEFU|nr:unnamed protein product [Owenia fusiformis]
MVDPVNPCLVLFIRRENIVQDTINQLQKQGCADFKKPLKVVILGEEALDGGGVRKVMFYNEEAVDEGGVRKEFFMLLLREILDPKFGMFKYYEESRLLWFSDQILDEDTTMFHLIGLVCGLAIYNATIIDLHFPQALFKKLLKREVTLDDLTDLDPSLGRSLKQLQEFEDGAVEETFGLTFQISRLYFDEVKSHDLVPNGANIPVTNDNRKEYVSAYIDFIFNRSVEQQFNAFSEGFHRVCGGTVLELFHPQELQAMVVGNENYDWEELEKNAQYKGEYEGGRHKTITFFWEVFRELNLEQKKKFLLFLTGSDRIPILGMKAVKIYIQPVGGGEDYLPVGHTCFNLLDLPKYNTKEKLREKLLIAIEHTTGFGLV